ncbi:MAG: GatB/YqeY domain-containing protein [Cellvibrionaceae bacterium]|nr:GatB/YqeY domain-containing protein [Cellvibrionaceae bacterium]
MANPSIKSAINDAMKAAMRAKDKPRLGTIRLMQSEFKRIEVDERIELDDQRVLVVLDKMLKQRRDSLKQYTDAKRTDLAAQEQLEIDVISEFLPQPLSEQAVIAIIEAAIAETGATGMQSMGKLMAVIRPQVQGRADMAKVSQWVKTRLG